LTPSSKRTGRKSRRNELVYNGVTVLERGTGEIGKMGPSKRENGPLGGNIEKGRGGE